MRRLRGAECAILLKGRNNVQQSFLGILYLILQISR